MFCPTQIQSNIYWWCKHQWKVCFAIFWDPVLVFLPKIASAHQTWSMINIHLWSTSWRILVYSATMPYMPYMQHYLWSFFCLSNTQICICWDQSPEWSTYLQPEWSGRGVKYGWHLGPWCQLARHHIFEQQWKPVCLLKESYSPVGLICHIHLVWCVVSPHSSMDGNLSVKRFWWVLGYNQISKLFWTLLDTYPFIDLNNMDQAWVLCDIQCAHITL